MFEQNRVAINPQELMEGVVSFRQQALSIVDASAASRKKIILLGKSGSGKTTLGNHFARQSLFARLPADGVMRIEGGEGIGGTYHSQTTFPNVFTSHEDSLFVLDCPGFGDTGGPIQELKNAFYIEALFPSGDALHGMRDFIFLLVVPSYHLEAVSRGEGFSSLLQSFIDLVGDALDSVLPSTILVISRSERTTEQYKISLRDFLVSRAAITDNHRKIIRLFSEENRHNVLTFSKPTQEGAYESDVRSELIHVIEKRIPHRIQSFSAKISISSTAHLMFNQISDYLLRDISILYGKFVAVLKVSAKNYFDHPLQEGSDDCLKVLTIANDLIKLSNDLLSDIRTLHLGSIKTVFRLIVNFIDQHRDLNCSSEDLKILQKVLQDNLITLIPYAQIMQSLNRPIEINLQEFTRITEDFIGFIKPYQSQFVRQFYTFIAQSGQALFAELRDFISQVLDDQETSLDELISLKKSMLNLTYQYNSLIEGNQSYVEKTEKFFDLTEKEWCPLILRMMMLHPFSFKHDLCENHLLSSDGCWIYGQFGIRGNHEEAIQLLSDNIDLVRGPLFSLMKETIRTGRKNEWVCDAIVRKKITLESAHFHSNISRDELLKDFISFYMPNSFICERFIQLSLLEHLAQVLSIQLNFWLVDNEKIEAYKQENDEYSNAIHLAIDKNGEMTRITFHSRFFREVEKKLQNYLGNIEFIKKITSQHQPASQRISLGLDIYPESYLFDFQENLAAINSVFDKKDEYFSKILSRLYENKYSQLLENIYEYFIVYNEMIIKINSASYIKNIFFIFYGIYEKLRIFQENPREDFFSQFSSIISSILEALGVIQEITNNMYPRYEAYFNHKMLLGNICKIFYEISNHVQNVSDFISPRVPIILEEKLNKIFLILSLKEMLSIFSKKISKNFFNHDCLKIQSNNKNCFVFANILHDLTNSDSFDKVLNFLKRRYQNDPVELLIDHLYSKYQLFFSLFIEKNSIEFQKILNEITAKEFHVQAKQYCIHVNQIIALEESHLNNHIKALNNYLKNLEENYPQELYDTLKDLPDELNEEFSSFNRIINATYSKLFLMFRSSPKLESMAKNITVSFDKIKKIKFSTDQFEERDKFDQEYVVKIKEMINDCLKTLHPKYKQENIVSFLFMGVSTRKILFDINDTDDQKFPAGHQYQLLSDNGVNDEENEKDFWRPFSV